MARKVDECRQKNRRGIDRLKNLIKHFSTPPIQIDSTFEQFEPHFKQQRDFEEIEDEDVRRYYFEKFIRHLKKKAGIEVDKSDDELESNNESRNADIRVDAEHAAVAPRIRNETDPASVRTNGKDKEKEPDARPEVPPTSPKPDAEEGEVFESRDLSASTLLYGRDRFSRSRARVHSRRRL